MSHTFNLHNVRFYDYHPGAIHCISYNKNEKLLALSRADGSIEIWNIYAKPFKQKTLVGHEGSSVESLVWGCNHLYSAGLNPYIMEYDTTSFSVRRQVPVTGGPTWCMAISPNGKLLAAGTEDGFICLFDVKEDGLEYCKTVQKQKKRILSLGWHADSRHLVTGSINFVTLLCIEDNQNVVQFPVSKTTGSLETIVWCVAVLDDKTIVTGDSRGKTCFWDGNFGTLINGIQTHQADVLTMQVRPDNEAVYVAGVDPLIVELRLTDTHSKHGKKLTWVKSFQRRVHTHDVRSLTLTEEAKLFSGGVDTHLALSFYPPKTAIKYAASPPHGYISVSSGAGCVLLGYKNRMELWKLGKGNKSDTEETTRRFLSLLEDRTKLLEVHLRKKERLQSCALSPNSNRIAYVVNQKLKILQIVQSKEETEWKVEKLDFEQPMVLCSQVLWLDDNKLLVASFSTELQILEIRKEAISVLRTVVLSSGSSPEMLAASKDGSCFAVLDCSNKVTIFIISAKQQEIKEVHIPKTKVPVTSFTIHSNNIILAYSNMTLSEYNLETGICTSFGRELSSNPSPDIQKSSNVINRISCDDSGRIFLTTMSSIFVIQRENVDTVEKESFCELRPKKIAKSDGNATLSSNSTLDNESSDSSTIQTKACSLGTRKLNVISRTNHVLFFSYINPQNLVSVEQNPIALMDSLPPALKIKKFGAK